MTCPLNLLQICQIRHLFTFILLSVSLKVHRYRAEGGRNYPFQLFGDPNMPDEGFSFTPAKYAWELLTPPCLGSEMLWNRSYIMQLLGRYCSRLPDSIFHGSLDAYNKYPVKRKIFHLHILMFLQEGLFLENKYKKG